MIKTFYHIKFAIGGMCWIIYPNTSFLWVCPLQTVASDHLGNWIVDPAPIGKFIYLSHTLSFVVWQVNKCMSLVNIRSNVSIVEIFKQKHLERGVYLRNQKGD